MTRGRRAGSPASTVDGGAAAPWSRRSSRRALIRSARALHAHGAVLASLGRAHRAADLAPVVHAHGRAGAARDRGRARRPRALPPRPLGARVPRLAREHPAVVHLAPALVGPPAAGLVLRRLRGDLRVARARPSAAARATPSCAATRTCSTPGSRRRCGRSRRSDGRSDTPELRAFYPTDVLVTARDIIFLWVARMVMMGLEFLDEVPVLRRRHHLDHPGARRAAHVEVARHRHRPARRDRGARRGRRALRPARDVLLAGRALLAREDPAGPAAREQDLERVAAGAARRSPTSSRRRARARSRTAGSSRACSARSGASGSRSPRTTSRMRRSTSTASSTASSPTGTSRWRSPASTRRTRTCPRRCCTCSGRRSRSRTRSCRS